MSAATITRAAEWTPERIEALARMWRDGRSATEIAGQLGGVSRSAVMGKVRRLKLSKRTAGGTETKAIGARIARAHKRLPVRKKAEHGNKGQHGIRERAERRVTDIAVHEVPVEEGVDVSHLVGILDVTDRTCRWPHGDPLKPGFGFCGVEKDPDAGPYCPEHTRRAVLER